MQTPFATSLLAIALFGGCLIESVTFTPLADDAPEPDAEPGDDCGDGVRQQPEVCDGADLADADCTTAGDFTGGSLACSPTCTAFDTSACESAVSVPQLRQPMNNAYVGVVAVPASLRPTFVWEASTAVSGETISYELQYSTDATFSTGVTTVLATTTSHQPATDLSVATSAPVGARYYWRVRACAGADCSSHSPSWRVNVGRSNRDFNGDGYSDLVVGAPTNGSGGFEAGRVYVCFGAPGGTLDTIADGTLTGSAGELLGLSVATAGDVNGDGFADIIVGARGSDVGGADTGRAYVYLGGSGATFNATPDGTLSGAAIGDIFGNHVASAGDVNADGYADVIVSAPSSDADGTNAGRAYVFLGGPGGAFDSTADGTLTDGAAQDYYGGEVASAGDVNGDGFADVVVGNSGSDVAGFNAGRAYVYFGGSGETFDAGADGTLTGAVASDAFGSSVASAGDVNGDGFADVVVGAYFNGSAGMNAGRTYVYYGGAGTTFDELSDGAINGAAAADYFGTSVASAGDVNSDGFADIVVGADGNDAGGTGAGRSYVYLGGASAVFDNTADGTLTGAAAGDMFGASLASAGDINGDGFHDIVVGAYANDAGGTSAGQAYVYFGAPSATFDGSADATLTGSAGENFGRGL